MMFVALTLLYKRTGRVANTMTSVKATATVSSINNPMMTRFKVKQPLVSDRR
jgi:hypothetical protein